jgi:PEP-CTERM motif-containing protein
MKVFCRFWLLLVVALGSTFANATLMVTGTPPGCLSPGGPTPETFCNSSFTAALNTTNGFDVTVTFDNQSYVKTLLTGTVEVDLFFSPNDFPDQILTVTDFGLLDSTGNDLGIAFTRVSIPSEIRFDSSSAISSGTFVTGFHLAMTCNDTSFPGACDSGLTFGTLAIAMDDQVDPSGVDHHSLEAGRFTAVPEPSTLALLGLGFAGLGGAVRKKQAA